MSHLFNCTATYRCSDDIGNLKIRIKLREENSDKWDERVFAWQEKVHSRSEREFYKDDKKGVKPQNDEGAIDLFSYTNVVRQIGNDLGKSDSGDEEFDYKQSLHAAVRNPAGYNYDFDAMFVMADFGEFVGATWISHEEVLCTIKYDKKLKVVCINPDFTTFEPYSVKIDGRSSRTYKFYVEDASERMSEDDEIKETELIRKINANRSGVAKSCDFSLPPKNRLHVVVVFEILWGKNFEHDFISVKYFIDLPKDWFCEDGNELEGVTQTCRAKTEHGLAHFGHVFELTLQYNIEQLDHNSPPKCPYIYFEVISKDGWGRYRTEGLTYASLPVSKPGNHTCDLQCLRLVPNSISGQLRRFFIGDCSSYSDVTWIGIPKEHEAAILNKYGTETVGTGVVGVRMNILHQSQALLDKYNENSNENLDIFEKLSSSSLVKSVEQVVRAFRRARKNMIAARKNL